MDNLLVKVESMVWLFMTLEIKVMMKRRYSWVVNGLFKKQSAEAISLISYDGSNFEALVTASSFWNLCVFWDFE